MSYLFPAGLPTPSPRRRARRAVLGGHAGRQAAHPEVPRLRRVAMGAGMDLPPLPQLRPGVGGDRRARAASTATSGRITRCTPALNGHGPYIVVLVELPEYGNIRMVGNLLGDPQTGR